MNMPSIAIVGSGPSGCYVAQALRKQFPESEISMYDRMPVPYGLVRYGVAPDHVGTKSIAHQFERLFTRESVSFIGNIEIGRDITLDELRNAYDVVVLASGLCGDRDLGILGENLHGVYRAGSITRLFNDHPDEQSNSYQLGQRSVIVGNGNVAIDVLRLISKSSESFAGSEVSDQSLQRICRDHLIRIDIVGRSPLSDAKFDIVMLKELSELEHVNFHTSIDQQELLAGGARGETLKLLTDRNNNNARMDVYFHFGWVPVSIKGGGIVEAIKFEGKNSPTEILELTAGSVITAIGFNADRIRDFNRETLLGEGADLEDGKLDKGLYCVGWFKRGSQGTIAQNRADSKKVASRIIADYEANSLSKEGYPLLAEKLANATDFAGWKRVDELELSTAPENRNRLKISKMSEIIEIARQCAAGE